jgi:membrane associated rhomboid family serine protease
MDPFKDNEEHLLPPNAQKTLEWIAVLSATGFDYRLSHEATHWVIHLLDCEVAKARAEIDAYEMEEQKWASVVSAPPDLTLLEDVSWSPWWVAGLLATFYAWLGPFSPESPVLRCAVVDSTAVSHGEWWRLITGLTVHSGITHVGGNVICLLWFGHALCRIFGGGITWTLILASGIVGNYLAWLVRGTHGISLGASTAGFGALGILSAHAVIRNMIRGWGSRDLWAHKLLPLGAGLALLAFLGSGPGTDLAAHLFGFVCGMVLCLPVSWFDIARFPAWGQRVLQVLCIAAVMAAWRIVLLRAGV